MKLTLKQRVAKISVMALAVTGLVGASMVAESTVGAEAAQAASRYFSVTQCRMIDAGPGYVFSGTNSRYGLYCYYDYSWELEIWPTFKRDGWYFASFHNTQCAPTQYGYYCATRR